MSLLRSCQTLTQFRVHIDIIHIDTTECFFFATWNLEEVMHGLPREALEELDTLFKEYQETWNIFLPKELTAALDEYKIAKDRRNHTQMFQQAIQICKAYSNLIVSHHLVPSFAKSNLYNTYVTLQKYKLEENIGNGIFYNLVNNPLFKANSFYLDLFLRADVFKEDGAKSSILRYLSYNRRSAYNLFQKLKIAGLLQGEKAKDNILKLLSYVSEAYGTAENLHYIIEKLIKNNLFNLQNAQKHFDAITKTPTYEYISKLRLELLNLDSIGLLSEEIGMACFNRILSTEVPDPYIYSTLSLLLKYKLNTEENCKDVLSCKNLKSFFRTLNFILSKGILNSTQSGIHSTQTYFSWLIAHTNQNALFWVLLGLEENQILDEEHFRFFLFKSPILFDFEGADKVWLKIPKTALTQEHFQNLQKICADNEDDTATRQKIFIAYAMTHMQSKKELSDSADPEAPVTESKRLSAQEPEVIKQSSKAAREVQAGMYLPYVPPKIDFIPPRSHMPS